MSTVTASASVSVSIGPVDDRCRYWAKVIRSTTALPMPSAVDGASSLPGAYLRRGNDELLPGDWLIEGEEMHHRKARGWNYTLTGCAADGSQIGPMRPSAEIKAALKAQGLAPELLTGAGDVAACVRIIHAARAGLKIE